MKKIKMISLIMVLTASMSLLCGCGGSDGSNDESEGDGAIVVTNAKAVMEGDGVLVEE